MLGLFLAVIVATYIHLCFGHPVVLCVFEECETRSRGPCHCVVAFLFMCFVRPGLMVLVQLK